MKKIYKLFVCVLLSMSFYCVYAESSTVKEGNDPYNKKEETGIYPNPSSMYVSIVSESIITKIEIRNLTGAVVFEKVINEDNYLVDVSSWPRGKYIVTIFHEKNFEMKRLSVY